MTEFTKIIAETEGIRTPTKKRTRKDVAEAFENFQKKKAAKKANGSAKAEKSAKERKAPAAKSTAAKPTGVKPSPAYAEAIPLNFISATGYVREAGYDPKTSLFYIAFAKSTWAMPSSKKEWDDFEKAVADPNVDTDAYYRKAFRGRTASMLAVRKEVTK